MSYYSAEEIREGFKKMEQMKAVMQTNMACDDLVLRTAKEDVVNHPSHYETGKFECIEVMEEAMGTEAVKNFCICNAFKYLYRHKNKNGLEDIKKAKWYLDRYIKLSEGEGE